MLSLPFHRCRLRFSTGLTLLVWVLASLVSVVNACQWQPHATRAPQSITAQRLGRAALTHEAGHAAEHAFAAACLARGRTGHPPAASDDLTGSTEPLAGGDLLHGGVSARVRLPERLPH